MKNATSSGSRRIVVLGTGGTIAGSSPQAGDNIGYVAGTVPVSELLGGIPAPDGFTLHAEQIAQLDSKDMDFATWHALRVRSEHWLAQDDVAGLVITHGTDTIEETSFFLHSVIQSSKPVVLTCAMRPSTSSAPDGPQNLCDAIAVATTAGATGVVVVCAGEVHGTVDIRKDHPYRLNAFGSGDAGPIGYVEEGQVRLLRRWPREGALNKTNASITLPTADRWPRVEIVLSHAGASGKLIDTLIRERQEGHPAAVAGIVLGATGNGSLHHDLENAALRAQAAGIEVIVATRCAEGRILPAPNASLSVEVDLSPVKARVALLLKLCERAIDPL
ncbi:asparaginase [Halomonas sp. MCCC 1A11036]|uniref:Asparaginase n=1 Tax=Billgrantia zhangzhouensis TaxID=2733481 RepID=A0ABS9AIK0_9GAMM|nr:asparaginase [Halomonas zhangzhouensis]MCE8021598.1 asparaginase [Halomonas zhangzhouensis]